MKLYKDKDCTQPAECPMSLANPNLDKYGGPYVCNTNCAWNVYFEQDDDYMCGVELVRQHMFAKAGE